MCKSVKNTNHFCFIFFINIRPIFLVLTITNYNTKSSNNKNLSCINISQISWYVGDWTVLEMLKYQPVEAHRAQRRFAGQWQGRPHTDRGYSPPLGSGDWPELFDLGKSNMSLDKASSVYDLRLRLLKTLTAHSTISTTGLTIFTVMNSVKQNCCVLYYN